ncbi:hypothetical protein ABPG72_004846 [Tetrahymena utriculariae]
MNFTSVKQLLLNHKKIQILDKREDRIFNILREDDILNVEDQNGSHFSLHVNNMFDVDNDIKNEKIRICNLKIKSIEQCDHPNIIKIIDHFIIENYFFILFEQCQNNLKQWIQDSFNEDINDNNFANVCLQILKGVQYLHKNQMFLNNVSLTSIRLDSNNVIKIWSFLQLDSQDNQNIQPKQFSNDDQFTYNFPNQVINAFNKYKGQFDSSYKASLNISVDMHYVYLWIYQLSGATQYQLYRYAIQKQIKIQPKVSFYVNLILQKLAQLQEINMPKIDQVIELFENLEKHINFTESSINVEEEDEKEQSLLKQVFELFENQSYQNCIDILRDLILKNPRKDLYLAWMGRVCNAKFDYNQCNYWSQQALKLNQFSELSYYNLALQINQKNDLIYNNLGVVFNLQSKDHQSIAAYSKALKIKPLENDYLFNKSRSKYTLCKYESSLKMFKKLLNIKRQSQTSICQKIYGNSKTLDNLVIMLFQSLFLKQYPAEYFIPNHKANSVITISTENDIKNKRKNSLDSLGSLPQETASIIHKC